MMMPNPTIQRHFWDARRARPSIPDDREALDAAAGSGHVAHRPSLRIQVGHWLIGAGSRLSGERVETIHHAAHHSAPQRAA